MKSIYRNERDRALRAGYYRGLHDMSSLLVPMILGSLIEFLGDQQQPLSHGLFLAFLLLIVILIRSFLLHHYQIEMHKCGIRAKGIVLDMAFKKVALSVCAYVMQCHDALLCFLITQAVDLSLSGSIMQLGGDGAGDGTGGVRPSHRHHNAQQPALTQLVHLIQTDAQLLEDGIHYLHLLWAAPMVLAVVVVIVVL